MSMFIPCLFTATKYMQFKLFLSGWCFPYFITEISLNEKYLLWAAKFGKTLSSKFCLRTASSYQITQWKGTGSSYQWLISKSKLISNILFYINRVCIEILIISTAIKLHCDCIIKHSQKFWAHKLGIFFMNKKKICTLSEDTQF